MKEQEEDPANPKEFLDFKENLLNYAKQLDNNLEEAKNGMEQRVEQLRAKLIEQEERVAEFDEVVASLEEKITYIQFRADDVLDTTIKQTQDAEIVINGINAYTKQLTKNQEVILQRLESQIHQIELDVPL